MIFAKLFQRSSNADDGERGYHILYLFNSNAPSNPSWALYQQKESITGWVASQSTNTKIKNYV